MSSSQAAVVEPKLNVAVTRKNTKKSKLGTKSTTVAAYTGVFLLIMSMVAIGYQPPQKSDTVANAVNPQQTSVTSSEPSVDQLVATRVAAGIAERTDLPIASNVANLSVSLSAESQLAQTNTNVISKPQIVQPSADSRVIKHYTAKAGDTTQKVASQFGVSTTTIKWANNLDSDAIEKGRNLTIPPVDGVIYRVQPHDTISSIAHAYKADADSIVAFNDLELDGIASKKTIVIPGGIMPADQRPGYTAEQDSANSQASYGGNAFGGVGYGIDPSLASASAGNRYAFGNCTSYAFERRLQLGRPVGSFWGNASTWASYASAAGYRVDGSPEAGAVMANGGGYAGYGHVAIVEEVAVGRYVRVSEMNAYRGGGGFNIVSHFDVPWGEAMSGMYQYIH